MNSKRVLLSVGAVVGILGVVALRQNAYKQQKPVIVQEISTVDNSDVLAANSRPSAKPKKNSGQTTKKSEQSSKIKLQKKLLWAEDFSGDSELPSSRYWNVATPELPVYNDEEQVYQSSSSNVRIADGRLILEARRTAAGIASGRIDTKAKLAITQGSRLEARVRLPKGKGTWPAFWLLSANQPHTAKLNPTDKDWQTERFYLRDGEIDIMEAYGNYPGVVEATVHTFGKSSESQRTVTDSTDKYHLYWLEWHSDKLIFGVDDTVYHTYTKPRNDPLIWPFTKDNEYYLILNLAMGGTGGGRVIASAHDRWQMEVDYVKYYRL